MKREKPPASPTKGMWAVPDKDWARLYPQITTHLCDSWWDDGSPRETSSLTVRMGEGSVQISLTDYELKRTAFTTADTFEAAMALMEEALAKGQCRFHPWKGSAGRPQRK